MIFKIEDRNEVDDFRWKSGSTLFKFLRSVKVPQKDGGPPIGNSQQSNQFLKLFFAPTEKLAPTAKLAPSKQ
jgi:hypothetical protein